MNQFMNPINCICFLKNFIFDSKRLKKFTPIKLNNYRNKSFRRIFKYALSVPLYSRKYREAGIHPSDIKSIDDIQKLPIITKRDLIKAYPKNCVPLNYNKKNAFVVCTSGSSGKPLSIFTDFSTMSEGIGTTMRIFDTFNLHWKKSKFAYIMNYSPHKPPDASEKVFLSHARSILPLNNHITISAFKPIKEIIEIVDKFQPDLIVSLPSIYQHLAYFKRKGQAKNINPKILLSGGYYLDDYTKNYVENSFGCELYNVYASAESNADISYECPYRTWHINEDFFHIEAINKQMESVEIGKRGHLVLTRLFGKGTPIIRYSGMEDWITIESGYNCKCGVYSSIIKNGVEGRINSSILLPDGRIYPVGSFDIISNILRKSKIFGIKRFQIHQKKIDYIEIYLEIDEDFIDKESTVTKIMNLIQKEYEKLVGPSVSIFVKEVDKIKSTPNIPPQLVISNVTSKDFYSIL